MMELIISAVVFAAVALVVVAVSGLARRDPALRRMRTASEAAPAGGSSSIFYERKQSRLLDVLEPVQKLLAQGDAKETGAVKQRLMQAGFYGPTSVEIYYSLRVALALGFAALAAIAILIVPPLGASVAQLIVLLSAAIGFYAPVLVLRGIIQDRRQAFRQGMPDAMDMILVGVEAGLSLPASIQHLCDEFGEAHPIIAEQFRVVTLEFQAGKSRSDALASLAQRMDVPEARVFASMIAQSDTLGTSLATTLRVLSDEMRKDRMLRAEHTAAELPVKISIPLVCCIFPALFSVIMTPLLIRIIRQLLTFGT